MIRVYIHDSMLFDGPRIYVVEENEQGQVTRVAQPVSFTMAPYIQGIQVPPSIDLGSIARNLALLNAFHTALEQWKKPIASPNDHRLAGQLDATQAHLHDLQILLHLKPNPFEQR